jgi:hypothetical protein
VKAEEEAIAREFEAWEPAPGTAVHCQQPEHDGDNARSLAAVVEATPFIVSPLRRLPTLLKWPTQEQPEPRSDAFRLGST